MGIRTARTKSECSKAKYRKLISKHVQKLIRVYPEVSMARRDGISMGPRWDGEAPS